MASPRIRYVNTASTAGGTGSTNATSGADRAYASLNACLTNELGDEDLVANDEFLWILCCGTTADTLQGWVTGFVTDATRFVRIEANPVHVAGRHPGRWSTSHYRLSVSEAFNHAVLVEQTYTQLVGLQIENTAGNADNSLRLNTGVAGDSGNDDCLCDSLIVRIGTTTYGGTAVVQAAGKARWRNCLFYGGSNGGGGFYAAYTGPGRADADLYHCVAANNAGPGFSSSSTSNDVNLTNCYAGGNGGDDFVGGGLLASITNCRSEDGTSGGAAVAFSTSAGAYFTNITPGSEDFHIGASSALRGLGTDLSAGMSRDIDGARRVAGDVGADEFATDLGDTFDIDSYFDWSPLNDSNVIYSRDAANGELDLSGADNDGRLSYFARLGFAHEAQVTMATGASRAIAVGVRMNDEAGDAYGIHVQSGTVSLLRFNGGSRTPLTDFTSAFTSGNFITVRLRAEGADGANVALSIWIEDHGASKPSDPGWLAGVADYTYTDSDASRLDDSTVHLSPGFAGRGPLGGVDTRSDFWRARDVVTGSSGGARRRRLIAA